MHRLSFIQELRISCTGYFVSQYENSRRISLYLYDTLLKHHWCTVVRNFSFISLVSSFGISNGVKEIGEFRRMISLWGITDITSMHHVLIVMKTAHDPVQSFRVHDASKRPILFHQSACFCAAVGDTVLQRSSWSMCSNCSDLEPCLWEPDSTMDQITAQAIFASDERLAMWINAESISFSWYNLSSGASASAAQPGTYSQARASALQFEELVSKTDESAQVLPHEAWLSWWVPTYHGALRFVHQRRHGCKACILVLLKPKPIDGHCVPIND